VEIGGGQSPDLIEIDGASNNSVDDIRELRDTVRYAPTRGRYKVYLVDEVHMLSKGAFNALLKTLEEPPPHVVFLFATTEANRIPETILSRVQRFDFKRIPPVAVTRQLADIAAKEGVKVSENALRLIARAGEGSMRDAQSLLDQVIAYAGDDIPDALVAETLGLIDRSLLYDLLSGLVTGEPDRCLDTIARVHDYGYELSELTGELLDVLRNATLLRLSPGSRRHVDVSEDEVERLAAIAEGADAERLARTFHAMLEVHDQVSRSERPRVVLEMAMARLATVRPVQPVGQLLGRLEDLERRLRQGGAQVAAPPGRGARAPRTQRPAPSGASADDEGSPGPGPVAAPPSAPRTPPPPAAEPVHRPPTTLAPTPKTPPPLPAPSAPVPAPEPDDDEGGVPSAFDDDALLARYADRDSSEGADTSAPADPRPGWWEALQRRLVSGPGAALLHGDPSFEGGVLRIAYTRARALDMAKRARRLPEVDAALSECYPPGTEVELLDRVNTGSIERDLLRQFESDPRVRRIVAALGAIPAGARPLTPGDPQ
jgi:DNA polymerase-3 subunit gamma/tau